MLAKVLREADQPHSIRNSLLFMHDAWKRRYLRTIKIISLQSFCMALFRWTYDDVIKWKHFPRYWPFVRGIHRWPVNSPHKDQWRRALIFSLIYAWTNGRINPRDAGDLRRHRVHYDITVMINHAVGVNLLRFDDRYIRHMYTKL